MIAAVKTVLAERVEMESEQDFQIPKEIWDELAKMQTMQNALTGACVDIFCKPQPGSRMATALRQLEMEKGENTNDN